MSSKEVGSFAIKNIIKTLRNCRLGFFGSFFNLKNMRQFKHNSNCNIELELNGEKYKLGKLVTFISSYSPTQRKNVYTFKCIRTGKTFTDIDKLSKHLAELLVKTKQIILT